VCVHAVCQISKEIIYAHQAPTIPNNLVQTEGADYDNDHRLSSASSQGEGSLLEYLFILLIRATIPAFPEHGNLVR